MRNERTILRHELIGLPCEVVDAKNRALIGVAGKIVDETMKTLVLDPDRRRRIPKDGTSLRIDIAGKRVIVDGSMLTGRPEDRIKKKFKTW